MKTTTSVVLVLAFVFILLVAYKYVSSSIQEAKEKAVIQERANVQQQAESRQQEQQQENARQLNACLVAADQKKNATILYWLNGDYMKSCNTERNINAAIFCNNAAMEEVNKAKAEAQIDKSECYKRYK